MRSNKSYTNMREMLKECLCEVQTTVANSSLPGISSGFQPLDKLICGFEQGKVYVVGGRPNMGKEEFMLSMIRNIALESKLPVLLFSTNYRRSEYVRRLLTIHCYLPSARLRQGSLDEDEWKRLDERVGTLIDAPLFMHDSLDLQLDELINTAQNCNREKGIKIIFIDCLQMIEFTKEENPSERVAKVMFSLKQLANLMDVPIVVGSMMGRSIEHREGSEGKEPQLMDLTNSSYIEGLADVIMMVHRPEYYYIFMDDNGRDLRGRINIIVKKNTLKPLGCILLDYNQETGAVSIIEYANIPSSKFVSLEELDTDNHAVKKLVDVFDLEEL